MNLIFHLLESIKIAMSPWWLSGEESACQCRCGFNPWVRRIPWGRKWHAIAYSCLENPMNRGVWGCKKSWTLSDQITTQQNN